jgi:adenylate cyclase class 2
MYEVELKFPLADTKSLFESLEQLGAIRGNERVQRDRYFNHPSRDFAQTDEALRIRSEGREARITYKGPIVDSQTKTRREIELPIGDAEGDDERLAQLLVHLGFREVRAVCKKRLPIELAWEGRRLDLAIDDVDGLGRFLEIETIADEESKDAARDCILRLAKSLGLGNSERRSYLSLLLAKDCG